MKALLSRLVLILAFLGVVRAALIVPFWERMEPKEPEDDPQLTQFTQMVKMVHAVTKSSFWKLISEKQQEMVIDIILALLHPPRFSPFGG